MKVDLSADALLALADLALANGTEKAWISIAIDWIKYADEEINRLSNQLKEKTP